jgi:membrane-associated phospholipid phosphatase
MMAGKAMRTRHLTPALLVVLLALPARAEAPLAPVASAAVVEAPPPLRLSWVYDGGAVAASAAAIGLSTLISVDTSIRWHTQILPIDDHLKGRYSSTAAHTSDVLLAVDVVAPVALFAGRGFDREVGKRVAIYGETILAGLALNSVVKYAVGRPRPYAYSDDPAVVAYAEGQGKDSRLSFYSGHASTTFSASVAGAYLFAQSTSDLNARAAVWGAELALAGATADLRTRAGKHFYSDVMVGAVVGSGLGVLIPYLHGGPKVRLSKREWLAIVLGPLVGIAVGELLPVGQ